MKFPGLVVLLIGSVITTLVNYFSVGGAGFEWMYAPIVLSVLGVIVKYFDVQTTPTPTPSSDFGGPAPQQESKMRRFLLG